MWPILQVQFAPKRKLNCHDRSDRVPSITKTNQENDLIDHLGAVYTKIEIELSWLIGLGANYDENQIGQRCDWLHKCGLCQK